MVSEQNVFISPAEILVFGAYLLVKRRRFSTKYSGYTSKLGCFDYYTTGKIQDFLEVAKRKIFYIARKTKKGLHFSL